MASDSIYKQLRQQIPREFRIMLSSFRGYSDNALGFYEFKTQLYERWDLSRDKKRELFHAKVAEAEYLAIILFTYALYLKFTHGDKAIKDAVATFNALGVETVNIGALELSKRSKYYDMGSRLAENLHQCIVSDELKGLFSERLPFYKIADWYKRRH